MAKTGPAPNPLEFIAPETTEDWESYIIIIFKETKMFLIYRIIMGPYLFSIRNYSILLFLFYYSSTVFAQTPDWIWAKCATNTYECRSHDICIDQNGNSYIIGEFCSPVIAFDSIILTNTKIGSFDVFIVKYNSNGNAIWAKSFGGENNDFGQNLTIDGSGNLIIIGQFMSDTITINSILMKNSSHLKTDIYIVKFDPIGNVIWANSEGGMESDVPNDICIDIKENIYLTGYFYSDTIAVDTISLVNTYNNTTDIFVIKYDSSGKVILALSAGGDSGDYGSGIAVDTNSNFYLTGSFNSSTIQFDTLSLINFSLNSDGFIAKYDSIGNIVWAKRFGGLFSDIGRDIVIDKNGNIYIVGGIMDYVNIDTFNITSNGGNDIFIAKINTSGNYLWVKSGGGSAIDDVMSVCLDQNNNIYLTGFFSSRNLTFGSSVLTNSDSSESCYDIFVIKLSSFGTALWLKGAAGLYCDDAQSISVDSQNNIYVTGWFESPNLTFNSTTLINSAEHNIFIAKLDNSFGIVKIPESPIDFSFFPNPCNYLISLVGEKNSIINLNSSSKCKFF